MIKGLISVIVPVYNVEKYIERNINSILNQTYNNYEIILINDGSKDKSGEICNFYAEKFKNIRVIHKSNEGLGKARNTGLSRAEGEYVIFIDSDDWIDDSLLQNLMEFSKKYNCDTVVSGLKRVNTLGNIKKIENLYTEAIYKNEEVLYEFLPRIIGRSPFKRDSIAVSSCAVLYSNYIINKNDLKFVSERDYLAEDLLFNIDYFSKTKSVCIAPVYQYNYFMNTGSLSTKYRNNRLEKYLNLYELEVFKLSNINILDICKYRLSSQYFLRIRNCIKQENIKISRLTRKQALKNINEICSQPLFQKMILEYPIKELGIKRYIFLLLVKYKQTLILYKLSKYL